MARVAVVHNTLDFHGGADVVCLAVCEALQRDHDVTLYTLSETAPLDLAERFEIALDSSRLTVRNPLGGRAVARALSTVTPVVGPQLPFRSVLIRHFFERDASEYDLVVSTANEFDFSIPAVQYIHYPQFRPDRAAASGDSAGALNPLWSRLAGPERGEVDGSTLLANSSWTADVFERLYGVEPAVLHPPVEPIERRLDWSERADGVVVGRIAPDKRVFDAIEIVDGVRRQGRDLHLHIVGAAPRAYRRYVARVERAAADRSYVTVERDVPRARLEELLRTHKYGINCKPKEHFGLSVAEYVAAGMVAFAPDSGGQREVLEEREDRLFGSVKEAIELLAAAIERNGPPNQSPTRFGRARFRADIRAFVDETLH
ncbi:glycosyltransferase family 4 protein [Halobellus captivus]|uniref:glycosyltransferase family 4 protein n=1 Tax=Halobellus captivus TaxID=2592614 RepID=UPI0011AA4614|nr:glycosyltransferase family 4 protein [Halobellus captivus]